MGGPGGTCSGSAGLQRPALLYISCVQSSSWSSTSTTSAYFFSSLRRTGSGTTTDLVLISVWYSQGVWSGTKSLRKSNAGKNSTKIRPMNTLFCSLVHLFSSSLRLKVSLRLQFARLFFGPASGKCLEETRSNTMLVATAWTVRFCLSDLMSCTLTSQSTLSRANTNDLPSFTSCTTWSRKCFPISSWIAYFMDFSRQNPYLLRLSTSLK